MASWGKKIVVAGGLASFVACGGAQPGVQGPTTPEPPVAMQDGPQVMIEGSSLMLIEDAGSTPLVIYFEVDSDVVEPGSRSALDALAVFLLNHERLRIEVQGHADERGPDVYNEDLSLRRAAAVKRYLVDRGVQDGRLRARGFGEQRPLPASDDAAHHRNRRVEFVTAAVSPEMSVATAAAR